jgi:hypothetical protein
MRLEATLDADGDVEETFTYVIQHDANGEPLRTVGVPKAGRNLIEVHYLPARCDPADQIAYSRGKRATLLEARKGLPCHHATDDQMRSVEAMRTNSCILTARDPCSAGHSLLRRQ